MKMYLRQLCRNTHRLPDVFKGRAVMCRLFCSSDENNESQPSAVDKQDNLPGGTERTTLPPAWSKEAEHFMANLDEDAARKKNEIDILIEIFRHEGKKVPYYISPIDWKILITECHGITTCEKMLKRIHIKEVKKGISLQHKKIDRTGFQEFNAPYGRYDSMSLEKMIRWWKLLESLKSNIPVLIDVDYESSMQLQNDEFSQMQKLWASNQNHFQPLDLHFTSAHKNFRLNEILKHDSKNNQYRNLKLYQEHFTELFPRENMVYLTPDGPPMFEFDNNCIYVLGATEDHTPGLSHQKANNFRIRSASFPISKYGKVIGLGPSLNLNLAYRILLDMYLVHSWPEALSNQLEERHFIFHKEWRNATKKSHTSRRRISNQDSITIRMGWYTN